jgi:hypothetical protein
MAYQWIPGKGPSSQAIERLRAYFPKPSYPMGEAWFMSDERTFYHELSEKPIAEIPIENLQHYLFEISSGISCFGLLEEWDCWFKYLLPDLILRSHETYAFETLIEGVVTAFMNVFWKGLEDEYAEFREDIINTLSLCLMKQKEWADCKNEVAGTSYKKALFLVWENEEGQLEPSGWGAGESNKAFSSMMFFCLKYLSTENISTWVESLLKIKDPYWRGTFMVWLLGAYDLLMMPVPLPSKLEKTNPRVHWHDSHVLGSRFGSLGAEEPPDAGFNDNKDFLVPENNAAFLAEIRERLAPEEVLNWTDSLSSDKKLAESLLNTHDLFFDRLFGNRDESPSII